MLKVTRLNVTKMGEDGLYLALADLTEKDEMYPIIEAELDRRAQAESLRLDRQAKSKMESLKLTTQIQSEIKAMFDGFKGAKTLLLIEHFGQEFIEDYTLDEETCTIYSKVSHEIFNNPDSWELDTIEQARRKLAKLIYNRVYDKFMRNPTNDNLELLKRVIGG